MSLKKLTDINNNDIQVDSAIKDAKGQNIHSTYQEKLTTSNVSDGTIDKSIGFDTNGNIVKGTASGGSGTLYKHRVSIEGTDEADMPLDSSVELVFITSSSTPITTFQSVSNNSAKLIYGVYDTYIIYLIDTDAFLELYVVDGASIISITPTDIYDTVTAL